MGEIGGFHIWSQSVYMHERWRPRLSLVLPCAMIVSSAASTPDTPCIAICSTSQGDPECKGCGRSFEEVQMWTEMTPGEKRAVWRRITVIGTSWRFNKYAERAAEDRHRAKAAAAAQAPLGF